jgi:hypothetical protein
MSQAVGRYTLQELGQAVHLFNAREGHFILRFAAELTGRLLP